MLLPVEHRQQRGGFARAVEAGRGHQAGHAIHGLTPKTYHDKFSLPLPHLTDFMTLGDISGVISVAENLSFLWLISRYTFEAAINNHGRLAEHG